MTSVLADTGVLCALADPDDQYFDRAQEELARLQQEDYEVLVAYPILLECYSLVQRKLGLNIAQSWLGEVQAGVGFLEASTADYDDAIEKAHAYADQHFSLFDLTLAVLSARFALPVWTFDHDFDVMRVNVWR